MWNLSLPWWHFIVRALIIYVFLLVLLRLTGKRQVGQLSPFDLVLLLVLANAVQNAMNGGDNSVTGGVLLAGTLVAVNYAVGWLTWRSRRIEMAIEGRPVLLIHHGVIDQRAMGKAQLTRHELVSALRVEGCAGPDEVLFAVLENNGHITVVPKRRGAES
jgi:uncharacterized membrane protein YcaP (DUF421 family)